MADKRSQRETPQPAFGDVLRRMLATPPDPHVTKKKPAKRKKK